MNLSKPSRPWLVLALVLSLAVNLFLGAFLAGRWAGQAGGAFAMKHRFEETIADLPAEKRQQLRAEMHSAVRDVMPVLKDLRQTRHALMQEFLAPAPDNARIDEYFAQIREQSVAAQGMIQQHFHSALAHLSPEERRLLIQRLQARQGRFAPERLLNP